MVAKPKPLNDRDQAVLRLVVERFISTAEPVASQALGELQVSSATIRNTMAKLEAHGLLEQPHTSAGRVPTEAGLRLYVDQLMATQPLTQREQSQIETKLLPKLQGSSVYTSGAKGLAEVASHLAVVVPPRLPTTIFETIELVKAGDKRLVVVCVSRGGDVHHKLIELGEDIERHTLDRMNALLREVFSGLSLVDMRTRLAAELSAERAREDQLYRKTIELAVRGVPEVDQAEVCVEGTSQILMQADAAQVQKLLTAVEEKRLLLSVLERLANDGESHIGLGVRELAGLAVVAAPFGGEGGVLAVVGPMRMNYARLVPVVAYCANIMTKHLGALP